MKRLLPLVFLFAFVSSEAQILDTATKMVQYLLPAFTRGVVKQKNGTHSNQVLNYNLITKEMVFEYKSDYLAIAEPQNVDSVVIGERRFVPVGKAFYEWIGPSLYADYGCIVHEKGAPVGIGSTSTSNVQYLRGWQNDAGGVYKLKIPEEYQLIPKNVFFVKKDGKFVKVTNAQQVIKLYPDKKELINEWVKTNRTDFNKKEDVLLLFDKLQ